MIKCSSKDQVLIKNLVKKICSLNEEAGEWIIFSELLTGCDAYIATGSNNTARYFEYYFGKYPSIIRRNRTSVAILNGKESPTDLEHLADDVCQYFGLGCRNVTKILVPKAMILFRFLMHFRNMAGWQIIISIRIIMITN